MTKWVDVECIRYMDSQEDRWYPFKCSYGDLCCACNFRDGSKEGCKYYKGRTDFNSDFGDYVKCSLPNSIRFITED